MTKIPVSEAPASPWLDAAVARAKYGDDLVVDLEHGLIATSEDRLRESLGSGWIGWDCGPNGEAPSFCMELPKYSMHIGDAWDLKPEQGFVVICRFSDHSECEWHELIDADDPDCEGFLDYDTVAETAPLAITRAYLLARGVTEIEVPESELQVVD